MWPLTSVVAVPSECPCIPKGCVLCIVLTNFLLVPIKTLIVFPQLGAGEGDQWLAWLGFEFGENAGVGVSCSSCSDSLIARSEVIASN